jgi:hypothetical protein
MKACILPGMIALEFSPVLGGCGYTHSSVERVKVTSAHIQEIKIGRTLELDLIKLLGSPTKKEKNLEGNDRLVYESTEIKSLTFPGGYQARGFFDKEEDESFETILKDGVVQNYRFIKP